MYLLSLGEFDYENFGERGSVSNILMWIIFVLGTFLLQITFMNMLIAIMGEVFTEVTERKKQSSLTERIALLNDFREFVDSEKTGLDAQFIFLIKPTEENDLEEDLEEKVTNIREAIEIHSKEIQVRQDRRNEDAEFKYLELKNELHRTQEIAKNEMYQMTERILREVQHNR